MNRTLRHLSLPLLLTAGTSSAAYATGSDAAENLIGSVSVEETADQTVIRIPGDASPTYSVYRLRNPLRLFVDVSNAEVANDGGTVDVFNGVISQVATVEYSDTLTQVARVVVGFEQDATYDVTTDGNDLVVTIDGALRRESLVAADAAERVAALESELAASLSRAVALDQALADAESRAATAEATALTAQIERENAEQARLLALAAQGEGSQQLDTLRAEYDARLASLASEQQRLSAELAVANSAATSGSQQLAALEAELATARAASSASSQQLAALEAELAAARTDGTVASTTVAALQAELDAARARATQAENAAADAQAALASAAAPVAAAPAPAAPVGPVAIADVRFEQADGIDRVIIEVPAGAEFTSEAWGEDRSALTFQSVVLPDALRRTLDTQAFEGALSFVSSYSEADGQVRVVAQLQNDASEVIRQEDNRIVWEFIPSAAFEPEQPALAATASAPASAPIAAPVAATSWGESYGGADGAVGQSPFQRTPQMTNKRITIDLRNADIHNVLRLLADEGNINIVAADDVTGAVTLRLRSVPLDDALAIILRSKGLGWEQEGNILRVASLQSFEDDYDRELQRLADSFGLEALQVRLIPVNYAEAGALMGVVNSVLSSRGSVSVDTRSNMLVVTDIYAHLETASALVAQLDLQTPQVLIEARIVETNDQFRRQLGIQWGGDYVADQSIGNSTGLLFPSTIGIAGGATDGSTPLNGGSSSPNYAVNLPAPAGTNTGGALGFTFGSLSGSFNLNVRLSAAESEGSAKVVSAPRIMTLDNVAATITSGVSIPVSVVSAAGAQTQFVDASLSLAVTPRVTPDGNIFLQVNVSKNEPDFENTGSRGDPSIIRREASTQLLVRDGDTTVIGGIFQRNTGFSSDRVPFLGSLPIIGALFRNSSRTDVRNELLVFITPRIVNRDTSIDQYAAGADIVRPGDDD